MEDREHDEGGFDSEDVKHEREVQLAAVAKRERLIKLGIVEQVGINAQGGPRWRLTGKVRAMSEEERNRHIDDEIPVNAGQSESPNRWIQARKKLVRLGLVEQVGTNEEGETIWGVTAAGRAYGSSTTKH